MSIEFYSVCSLGHDQGEDTGLYGPLDCPGVGFSLVLGKVRTVTDVRIRNCRGPGAWPGSWALVT